ncbi:MAG: sulfate ABC transporter substrate-binding protein [Planctomycetia bacterium]
MKGRKVGRRTFTAALTTGALSTGPLAGLGCTGGFAAPGSALFNVSYDPTRELWKEINELFLAHWKKAGGSTPTIYMSHGGSSAQARSILEGKPTDVATLAIQPDVAVLQENGLVAAGWEKRLPNNAVPFMSTIVFVVRKGNPKGIKDWPDLTKDGVEIVTPNPKTGGNGKLSFLAAWGSVTSAGGDDATALEFTKAVYERVPVLDSGARAAATTFAQRGLGDVHLTWENEAWLEVAESKGTLDVVYPSSSFLAEPPVAVVDTYVDENKTRDLAEAYLQFAYTPEAQDVGAKKYFRPFDPEIAKKHADRFPPMRLFRIDATAADWPDAMTKYFADDGVFDQIQSSLKK